MQIVLTSQYDEKNLGCTVFGLNQARLVIRFAQLLEQCFIDHGFFQPINETVPKKTQTSAKHLRIMLDFPLLPRGEPVNRPSGVIVADPLINKVMAGELTDALQKWGLQSSDRWNRAILRVPPTSQSFDLRLAPFFVDCIDAVVFCERLENLASRLVPVFYHHLTDFRPLISRGVQRNQREPLV